MRKWVNCIAFALEVNEFPKKKKKFQIRLNTCQDHVHALHMAEYRFCCHIQLISSYKKHITIGSLVSFNPWKPLFQTINGYHN